MQCERRHKKEMKMMPRKLKCILIFVRTAHNRCTEFSLELTV